MSKVQQPCRPWGLCWPAWRKRLGAGRQVHGAALLSPQPHSLTLLPPPPCVRQGSFQNLTRIRAAGVQCPLLCKEFIVEAYQVFKARARCVCWGEGERAYWRSVDEPAQPRRAIRMHLHMHRHPAAS